MKTCPKCGIEKPLEEFHSDVTCADGKRAYCKPCNTGQTLAAYYRRDPVDRVRRVAVSLYRRFKDDPEFWRLVETLPERRKRAAA